jgi:SpoVK/Ycf46/Vps4 family AAA+-type ATPase
MSSTPTVVPVDPHTSALAKPLSPTQKIAFAQLREAIRISPLVSLQGDAGSGKTLLAERLIAETGGGVRIGARDLLAATAESAHPGIEEQLHRLIEDALNRHPLVVVDEFDLPARVASSVGYVRMQYLPVALHALFDTVRASGKRLVCVGTNFWNYPEVHSMPQLLARALKVDIPSLTPEDYRFFLEIALGREDLPTINPTRVFDHAPNLSVYQLLQLGAFIGQSGRTDHTYIREMLDTRILTTNTNLGEVADVKFSDLKGFEDIIEHLTTYVLNPLLFDEHAQSLGLTPKRGVLLYGPPGTGKTSVGRALAHHMKGKFFLIDGTFTTEPAVTFYYRVKQVFDAAKRATPCVIFIDDADVLFQSDRATGLTRFLLSMLDGLESATAGKVAVIMTAMDPNQLPPALLRSGRVEMWLETKLPGAHARTEILTALVSTLPEHFHSSDISPLAGLTEGFNAADLKRVVADAKALHVRDVIAGHSSQSFIHYVEQSVHGVRRNKELLRLAEHGKLEFEAIQEARLIGDKKARSRREQEEPLS